MNRYSVCSSILISGTRHRQKKKYHILTLVFLFDLSTGDLSLLGDMCIIGSKVIPTSSKM